MVSRHWNRLSIYDKALVAYLAVVLITFGFLVLAGVSQSSIGIAPLQVDGQASDDVAIGNPRAIRSDEYLRLSPLTLGQDAAGSSDFMTPLGADPTLTSGAVNGGVVEKMIFAEKTLTQWGGLLPSASVFAANWWLMIVVALVSVPLLLRLWEIPLPLIAFATAGVIVNPAMFWWSFIPVPALALSAVVGCCIGVMWKVRGRWRIPAGVAAAAIGGVAMARLPYSYFPFAFPIAIAVIAPTFMLGISSSKTRRATLLVSGGILLLGGMLAAGLVLDNSEAFRALGETDYPGSRRVGGVLQNLGMVFGAPFLHVLQQSPELVGTNQSELSSAWTIAGVAALIIVASTPKSPEPRRDDWLFRSLASICIIEFSWILFTWPSMGEKIPLMNLIPPSRVAGIIGVPAILLATVALARRWRAEDRPQMGSVAGPLRSTQAAGVLFVLLVSGSTLGSTVIPSFGPRAVLVPTALTCGVVALMAAKAGRLRLIGVGVAIVCMSLSVWKVNPIMIGLGDLVESPDAQLLRQLSGESGEKRLWAGEDPYVNALLTANGIPSLSGDQWTGPSDEWSVLDPTGQYRSAWNRGASTILFSWNPSIETPVISAPFPDKIQVEASPCSQELASAGLGYIVTRQTLEDACLQPLGVVRQNGAGLNIYLVE